MRRNVPLILILALVLAAGSSSTEAERIRDLKGDLPQVLYTALTKHDPAYPTFVAGDAAINPDGSINQKLIPPSAMSTLRGILDQQPVDGCIRTEEVWWDEMGVPERPTLKLAAERSDLIVLGKVVAREAGFRFFEAGQLLEVKVQEVIRGHARPDHYFVFVPVADFKAGPYRICKIDRRYVAPPDVGERVVLLVPRGQDVDDEYVDVVDGSGLVVLDEGDRVRLPRTFQEHLQRAVDSKSVLSILRNTSRPSFLDSACGSTRTTTGQHSLTS